ncbi:MBL fold hydrolase [Solibaculum mannosilyticum]|uniref:MBL fold hydrolase n=2 Tax=Solibaculum mannosilyticum TaxID=2780922 RepID=A0A7I8D1W6_9FIRM|nr:MBL fold hydrolase [Solibaculum mannosilyticum]
MWSRCFLRVWIRQNLTLRDNFSILRALKPSKEVEAFMSRICTLFSGSSGNCTYLASQEGGILIDAGVSARSIQRALEDRDIDPKTIRAVFVTHEHTDHVAGLRVFCSRFGCKVYSSPGTLAALEEKGMLQKVDSSCIGEETVEAAGMAVRPFPISHDCAQGYGYRIHMPDGRKVAVATDTGVMTDGVREAVHGCDLVVIESNHDVRMLQNGRYPYYLKRRILSQTGHLSNDDCAVELVELVRSGTTRLILAHLSRENNVPELAYETAKSFLTSVGMRQGTDYLLSVAPKASDQKVMVF